jgi:hypothetical protein
LNAESNNQRQKGPYKVSADESKHATSLDCFDLLFAAFDDTPEPTFVIARSNQTTMSTDKVKLFGPRISLRESLMVLRDSLNGAVNSAAAELVLEQFVSKYRLAGAWNPPRSFDSLDGEESLVWRPVIASLRPWLELAVGRFRADMQQWGGLDAARREVAHSVQHSNWIELTVEQWADWADATHLHNRRLLRLLFNVIHFFSWRIKNTRLLMSLMPDMVHVLVFAVLHPAYRCLDMSRVVFGLLNTATLSDDKSVITALLPHLNALHAHVLYDPVASLDVVTQLRFARIVGHVAFFDEQAFFVALAQLGTRPSIFDWLLKWHSEVLSQYRQLLVLQNAEVRQYLRILFLNCVCHQCFFLSSIGTGNASECPNRCSWRSTIGTCGFEYARQAKQTAFFETVDDWIRGASTLFRFRGRTVASRGPIAGISNSSSCAFTATFDC